MPPLNPSPSSTAVRRFESGDLNSAIVVNVPAQGFLNQAEAISQDLEAIVTIQDTIAQRLTQLSAVTTLRASTIALNDTLTAERSQTTAADNQASAIETTIPNSNSAIVSEGDRVAPINTKLDGITTTTYQASASVLSAISAAPMAPSSYIYSNNLGAIAFTLPALSSGTRMRDCILKGVIASGNVGPAIPNTTQTNIPMVQTFNNASDRIAWNSSTQTLTLQAGEYTIDGWCVARGQLVQMSLLQQSPSARYWGTTGKGTHEGAIVGASESLTIYSHLVDSFLVTSARSFNPQVFLSSGQLMVGTLGVSTTWAFLRVRHFLY